LEFYLPSVETNVQTVKTILRVRTVCLGLMFLLLWWAEEIDSAPAIVKGWEIWGLAAGLGLAFLVLGRMKRLAGLLLPVVFLVDSCLISLWVSVSGGPVSFYMPFYLLILLSAIMSLTPRKALVVISGVLTIFLTTLYLDFIWAIPEANEAGKINFIVGVMDRLSPQVREGLYWQQAIRWFFFFVLVVIICALLMKQVWSREERLRIREKALEQKRHLIQMGELTGRVAHGVNTPLGLISGNLELLMSETRKGSGTHKRLVQIDQYVQRAIRTVREILEYSRQSMSEIKTVSLTEIIHAVISAVQPKLQKGGGQVILDLAPNLPGILGYPEGLYQVLLNLVENALDSISPGGIVTISSRFQFRSLRLSAQDQRGEIKVVVRDTGRGIPPGELKKIFEPFYSTKGFGKGTGLGLAIVKRIVDEHRGAIKVESRVGDGTVFTLLFPTEGLTGNSANPPGDFYYNETEPPKGETTE
jgi:signal transduction histidine kinase